jgi:hypothetical protein
VSSSKRWGAPPPVVFRRPGPYATKMVRSLVRANKESVESAIGLVAYYANMRLLRVWRPNVQDIREAKAYAHRGGYPVERVYRAVAKAISDEAKAKGSSGNKRAIWRIGIR